MKAILDRFENIIYCDFEYRATEGNSPEIRCGVFINHNSGQVSRLWVDELPKSTPINPNDLLVTYYAPAELSCFQSLGWKFPDNLIDLFAEHRTLSNGLVSKNSLLSALKFWKQASIDSEEKDEMRALALRPGNQYTNSEKMALLNYCQTDVEALSKLLRAIGPHLNTEQALYRGDYLKAVGTMEANGIPIDFDLFDKISKNEESLKKSVIQAVDSHFNVFEGMVFKTKLFEQYLISNNIPWPRLASGRLALDEESFSEQSKIYPEISPLHQTLQFKKKASVKKIAIGEDYRNRTMLSPFRSKTGRNQPSGNKFIFNCPSWVRGLIKPGVGKSLAYIDWSQQEFAIAASLSSDSNMRDAYESGDPYLTFGKQAGLVPYSATKESHKAQREQFKACVLAMNYGMGEETFSHYIKQPKRVARHLISVHKKTYSRFWEWSDRIVDFARQHGYLSTVLGWNIHIDGKTSTNSIRNFMMQAHGAEILRLACIFICEKGVQLCAPIHDAVLIESTAENIDVDIGKTRKAMEEAGEVILNDITLRTDVEKIVYPERYMDPRGETMWGNIMDALSNL